MKDKTKKLIYWLLPVFALILQVGFMEFLSFVLQLKPSPPSPFDFLGTILLGILVILLILIGYLIACLYKRMEYKSIVLVYAVLFFFALEVLITSPKLIHHDFGTEYDIWGVVVLCMEGIFIWNLYPVILSVLLYQYSKKIVYPNKY